MGMMKYLIFESPKKERKHSAPVAESDTSTRRRLEAMGWHVVQRIEDTIAVPVQAVVTVQPLTGFDAMSDQELWEYVGEHNLDVFDLSGDPQGVSRAELIALLKEHRSSDGGTPESPLAFVHELTDEQRAALIAAGFGTLEALRAATDEQLREVEGVGPAAVRKIRQTLLENRV
jgi:hypothetical protein